MGRGRLSAPAGAALLALGLVAGFLLACIVPSAWSRMGPAPPPAALTPEAPASTVPLQPGRTTIVATISEEDMNRWLQDTGAQVGEGIDYREMQLKVRSSGITLSGNVHFAQLHNVLVPLEIQLRPVLRDERLEMEVLDVQLGAPYTFLSSLVRPWVTTGLAHAFDAGRFLPMEGLRISAVELQDGCMVVTSVPAGS